MALKLPHVARPCRDCPSRKDSLKGWLGESRMADILKMDSFFCHKKTDKQCAGHMIIKGDSNIFIQLAGRMGLELELTGHELVFSSQQSCIKHHTRGG